METYIALLRGINVSGKNIIKMQDLKESMKARNFHNVLTYIQSGNVIFRYNKSATKNIETIIQEMILEEYKLTVPVLVKTVDDIKNAHKNNPYILSGYGETKDLHITFLSEKARKDSNDLLLPYILETDQYKIENDVIYLCCKEGYSKSKLSNNLIESKLKVRATTRNYRTVNKLIELSAKV